MILISDAPLSRAAAVGDTRFEVMEDGFDGGTVVLENGGLGAFRGKGRSESTAVMSDASAFTEISGRRIQGTGIANGIRPILQNLQDWYGCTAESAGLRLALDGAISVFYFLFRSLSASCAIVIDVGTADAK